MQPPNSTDPNSTEKDTPPVAHLHWTQTPEGRKRMSELNKASAAKRLKTMRKKGKKGGGIFQYLTPAQQRAHLKKMAAGRIKAAKAARTAVKRTAVKIARESAIRHRQAVETLVNGHKGFSGERYQGTEFPSGLKKFPRGIAKENIRAFAIEGAKFRLQQLDQEREVLMMFIGKDA